MKKIIIYTFLLISFVAKAQEKDKFLPKGNDAFEENNYTDAEADYRVSQSKFTKKSISSYNLGTAIYKQKKSSEAKYQFAKAITNAKSKTEKHKAFHNLGNCYMNEKDYSAAVESYKNALRNKPSDEQTRYNYALAKKMLKENPPKQNDDKKKDQNKDKKEDKKNQDKNKDQENKDKNKDKQDGKDNEDKNKEGDKDKKENKDNGENPQKQPSGVNKQRIESLLDAMNNEEKKVQDKVNLQKVKANPKKAEKDW